jgi:hypothetical protein
MYEDYVLLAGDFFLCKRTYGVPIRALNVLPVALL